jgi:uncharacterized repeat protein (TIGR03803 family)
MLSNPGGSLTVFKLNLDGSGYKVLQAIGTGSGVAASRLIQGLDGALYGSLFRLNLDGSGFAILKPFSSSGLVQASNGILYGTKSSGGASGFGFAFQINPDGSGYNVLHSFGDGDPSGALIQDQGGTLYGTTSHFLLPGSIFSLVPPAVMLPPSLGELGLHISFLGISGNTYTIQRATAVTGPWTSLGSVNAGNNGAGSVDDTNAPGGSVFYRTVTQ